MPPNRFNPAAGAAIGHICRRSMSTVADDAGSAASRAMMFVPSPELRWNSDSRHGVSEARAQMMSSEVRTAYKIARHIPHIFAQQPCFCWCSYGDAAAYSRGLEELVSRSSTVYQEIVNISMPKRGGVGGFELMSFGLQKSGALVFEPTNKILLRKEH